MTLTWTRWFFLALRNDGHRSPEVRFEAGPGFILLAWLLAVSSVKAQDNASRPDRSPYTLLNPTPRALLRELDTDRPDKTETPITVDAGHFQVEMDLFTYTYDRQDSGPAGSQTVRSWSTGPINFKLGLRNNVDLQLVLEPYRHVQTEETGI
jgi:hypothetical protein